LLRILQEGSNILTAVATSAIADGGKLLKSSSAGLKYRRVMFETVLCGPKKNSFITSMIAWFWYGFEPMTPAP
jgi:hypothetical protein